MIKRIIVGLLILCMLFMISCNMTNDVNKNVKEYKDTQNKPTNDTKKTDNNDPVIIPIEQATKEQLHNTKLDVNIDGITYVQCNMDNFDVIDNKLYYNSNSDNILRNSSLALYCDGYDSFYNTNALDDNISKEEFTGIHIFQSAYDLIPAKAYLTINGFCIDSAKIKTETINLGYDINDISINAFIKRNTDNKTFDVIIDPAYMYGLPVFHREKDRCKFNINGLNIEADTLQFTATIASEEVVASINEIDSAYQFAKLNLSSLSVRYEACSDNYSSTAVIKDLSIITKDTTKALTDYMPSIFEGKDPNMEIVYNTLSANLDTINTKETFGIVLLDLDFDNFPEVLVSKKSSFFGKAENKNLESADVDVYRISDGQLIYIDTLYNYHTIIYELGNILGIKTLEDSSKAWFNMSYKDRNTDKICDTDYLFKLNGDKLDFTEVFRTDENGDYYYFGKKMVFTERSEYFKERNENITYTKWNEFESPYGTWALIGRIKEDYCKDLKDSSYTLYSDWLANLEPYEESTKKELTKRSLKFSLANLVDAFYLGEYNPNKQKYEYRFLGDFAKPVIYLYPEKEIDVSVKINLNGILTCTYPDYNNGWNVTAYPDGKLINKVDDREYSYLYWEGKGNVSWDLSKGFVVKGKDTAIFLQDKLEYMGLTPKELNEFIVYWLPLMQDNKYNLITFQTDEYEENVKLDITPKPDSVLRIFMTFKPLENPIEVKEQVLTTFKRSGFTVIEWGGTKIE